MGEMAAVRVQYVVEGGVGQRFVRFVDVCAVRE